MHNYIKVVLAVLFLFIAFAVSACGKTSAPIAIEGSGYPHDYPRE